MMELGVVSLALSHSPSATRLIDSIQKRNVGSFLAYVSSRDPAFPEEGTMFDALFPRRLENSYRGRKLALWLFGLVVLVKIAQSVVSIFDAADIARTADAIPLDSYPPAAAQTIAALFALSGVSRLFLYMLCVLILVRYRNAVPLMFLVSALSYLAGRLVLIYLPIARTGTPGGLIVNQVLFGLMVLGLVLSLWKRPVETTA